jgi:hypothetical protein
MISRNSPIRRRLEKESKVIFAGNFNISFITDLSRVRNTFESEVELMTMESS